MVDYVKELYIQVLKNGMRAVSVSRKAEHGKNVITILIENFYGYLVFVGRISIRVRANDFADHHPILEKARNKWV